MKVLPIINNIFSTKNNTSKNKVNYTQSPHFGANLPEGSYLDRLVKRMQAVISKKQTAEGFKKLVEDYIDAFEKNNGIDSSKLTRTYRKIKGVAVWTLKDAKGRIAHTYKSKNVPTSPDVTLIHTRYNLKTKKPILTEEGIITGLRLDGLDYNRTSKTLFDKDGKKSQVIVGRLRTRYKNNKMVSQTGYKDFGLKHKDWEFIFGENGNQVKDIFYKNNGKPGEILDHVKGTHTIA